MVETSRRSEARQPDADDRSPASAAPPAAAPSRPKEPGEGLSDAAKGYYDAVSLFSSEKYKEALGGFKRIVDANSDPEYAAKALFDMGRCLFMLQQYELTIKHFTQLVQANPKHPDLVETLYYLGQSYEKKGDTERAKGFYKKILTMEQDEDASTRIKAKKALHQLEEASRG
jgi:TolA-binding protein